jgi:hypothetical protein
MAIPIQNAMKTTAKIVIVLILTCSGTGLLTNNIQAHPWNCQESFHAELLPYGNWINTIQYGMVWVPNVPNGFHPYGSDGHWVYSQYGWTWISYYSWGWIPFHYGRWYFDPWYGWAWVPGHEWGPGWVTWSRCDGYYGWAPLAPGFLFDRPVHAMYDYPVNHWVFVPTAHFGEPFQANHYLRGRDAERMHHRSSIITGINTEREGQGTGRHFRGPDIQEVRKTTGRDFRSTEIMKDNPARDHSNQERSVMPGKDKTGIRKGSGYPDLTNISRTREKTGLEPGTKRSAPRTYIQPTGVERNQKPVNRNEYHTNRSSEPANRPDKADRNNAGRYHPNK